MNNIVEPNKLFDFSKLTLSHPSGIQGGAYFTKLQHNNNPLYIQTTKSLTRQGFVKTGKKYYCDLIFDNNSSELIEWFEKLEEKCHQLIFEKAENWFDSQLEMCDIESAFNSILRVYKSGKFYLVRTNIKNIMTDSIDTPSVNIYNENEVVLTMDDVNCDTNIISILELQGIKFTPRNFQIDIVLKQVMVVNDEHIFKNCLIKKSKNNHKIINEILTSENSNTLENLNTSNTLENLDTLNTLKNLDTLENLNTLENLDILDKLDTSGPHVLEESNLHNIDINIDEDFKNKPLEDFTGEIIDDENSLEKNVDSNNVVHNETHVIHDENNLEKNVDSNNIVHNETTVIDDFGEFELTLDLENNTDSISLKKPNQVYYELYKEARNKAKLAKKSAIIAYLEAKNIKKTYMLENLNDSDSEFDEEIDEVTENELEGL